MCLIMFNHDSISWNDDNTININIELEEGRHGWYNGIENVLPSMEVIYNIGDAWFIDTQYNFYNCNCRKYPRIW